MASFLPPLLPLIKFFHLFFAFTWLGGIIFFALVLRPALDRVDDASRKAILVHVVPRAAAMFTPVGIAAVLFGYFTILAMDRLDAQVLFHARWGYLINTAFVLCLVMIFVGWRYTYRYARGLALRLRDGDELAGELQQHLTMVRGSAMAQFFLGVAALALMNWAGLSG